jgi:hypothetical protein
MHFCSFSKERERKNERKKERSVPATAACRDYINEPMQK